MKKLRFSRYFLLIASFYLIVTGCKPPTNPTTQAQQQAQQQARQETQAIYRVISGVRNIYGEIPEANGDEEKETEAEAAFIAGLPKVEAIDTSGCPDDFMEAFIRFRGAYSAAVIWTENRPNKTIFGSTMTAFNMIFNNDWGAIERINHERDEKLNDLLKAQTELQAIAARHGVH